ncbi:DUF185-domain-containing protein [Aulographum hederae CBS 113979]|uniref:Protein arginine methyltransferase NDUFAF7 n=1 Tax=Aulographum hederae CBS 113979 TaxID=1176131 RepID=A0A6G1GMT0_9PEZI|nr:DUF185-domain-containing protein [Aulographum hederae CBS 113979]
MRLNPWVCARRIPKSSVLPPICLLGAPRARWSSTEARQWSTPLAKSLAEAITTTGPISVASYMRQCLTSPDGGYYTTRVAEGQDQFGRKGDFITSPEISQVFGELIGIWVVAEWMAQGRKRDGVYLMEVGPGRGTLMDDMLRTIRNFKSMASSIESVYLVEASPHLRAAQHKLLCGSAPLTEIENGYQSTSKYSDQLKIIWYEDIKFVPQDPTKTPFIIAHEFFDALPIHIFQSVSPITGTSSIVTSSSAPPPPKGHLSKPNQWREMLVSPVSPHKIVTPTGTYDKKRGSDGKGEKVEFELTLSKGQTPHSLYLPTLSERYKALLPNPGSIIEISPESLNHVSDFAIRIGGADPSSKPSSQPALSSSPPIPSGAALLLDYNASPTPTTIPANTLRGIRSHKPCSPFSSPGRVDLSADVDFVALAEAAIKASPGVEVWGPVEQGAWLGGMGGGERVAKLMGGGSRKEGGEESEEGEERRKRIEGGWKRLIDRGPQGMGRLYKVMAVVPHLPTSEKGGKRAPVGFGGDVEV